MVYHHHRRPDPTWEGEHVLDGIRVELAFTGMVFGDTAELQLIWCNGSEVVLEKIAVDGRTQFAVLAAFLSEGAPNRVLAR